MLRLWAGVLHAVPQSRLLLKSKAFACETSRAAVLAGLSAVGVDGARVDLLPLHRTMRDHLASYALMDIALDTWPYAGTTTTCEAMHMGVPVVTLRGRTHAANVGVSLLGAVGLDHLAAEDDAGYVEAARALAAFDNIYWIAGGQAKDDGLGAALDATAMVRRAYLIGASAPAFAAALDGHCDVTMCGDLNTATHTHDAHDVIYEHDIRFKHGAISRLRVLGLSR